MNAVAIICEYNPLHTGHAYHIATAKELSGADTVIGIMSGYFVQRAEPAILSPQTRALTATHAGMDCVIQMPTLFSCAAANRFAEGAITILSRIPDIHYLAMGVEDSGNILQLLADIQCEQSPALVNILHDALDKGMPYAAAVATATESVVSAYINPQLCRDILHKPNNILAIEYLKAIRKFDLSITPVFIPRKGNAYHATQAEGEYISSTAARKLIADGDFATLRRYIPQQSFDLLCEEITAYPVQYPLFELLIVHALQTKDLSLAPDAGEGIEIKLAKTAKTHYILDDILQACKSKRYTMGRLKRLCLQTLLDITSDIATHPMDAMGRLLCIKESRQDLLRHLSGIAKRNSDYKNTNEFTQAIAVVDEYAATLYGMITGRKDNTAFCGKLQIV